VNQIARQINWIHSEIFKGYKGHEGRASGYRMSIFLLCDTLRYSDADPKFVGLPSNYYLLNEVHERKSGNWFTSEREKTLETPKAQKRTVIFGLQGFN
jgi:hypothetical protein